MKGENLLCLVIPVSQFLLLLGNASANRPLDFWGYGGIILSIAADVLLLYVLLWSSRKKKLRRELQEFSYFQEAVRMRNEALEERQKELFSMRSDFEERLNQIRAQLRQGEEEAARLEVEDFQKCLDATRPSGYCQNAVVNAVISEKEKDFRRLGVRADIHLLVPRNLKLDPLHLCSLFFNLLDNALEAVSELSENDREIEINAGIKGDYLVVKVCNPTTGNYAGRKRRKGRGYGTQILENLARTYEGSYRAGYENGWYRAFVVVKAV